MDYGQNCIIWKPLKGIIIKTCDMESIEDKLNEMYIYSECIFQNVHEQTVLAWFQRYLRQLEACLRERATKLWKEAPLQHTVVLSLALYSLVLRYFLAVIHHSNLASPFCG